ncbi:YopX family protein [Exiguobacterium artemiae]
MRDIRFRAWDNVKDRMYFVGEEDDISFELCSDGSFLGRDLNEGWDSSFPKLEHLQYMQYTGLKDRNGVEIYEGDIVTEHPGGVHFHEDDYEIREVKWGEFGWSPFGDVIGYKAHDFSGNLYEYIVIGNIYEKEERT